MKISNEIFKGIFRNDKEKFQDLKNEEFFDLISKPLTKLERIQYWDGIKDFLGGCFDDQRVLEIIYNEIPMELRIMMIGQSSDNKIFVIGTVNHPYDEWKIFTIDESNLFIIRKSFKRYPPEAVPLKFKEIVTTVWVGMFENIL